MIQISRPSPTPPFLSLSFTFIFTWQTCPIPSLCPGKLCPCYLFTVQIPILGFKNEKKNDFFLKIQSKHPQNLSSPPPHVWLKILVRWKESWPTFVHPSFWVKIIHRLGKAGVCVSTALDPPPFFTFQAQSWLLIDDCL